MTSLDGMPAVLTVKEAAEVLRCGRNQLYQAVAEGRIPSVRIGRTIRVPRHALEELLNGGDTPINNNGPGW